MTRLTFLACAFALLLVSTGVHGADLRWEHAVLEFHPTATDAEVKGEFRCENVGKKPITIRSVTPECGCTTALLDKATIQPGEKSVIEATFTIGQRKGRQEKHIR